MEKDGKAGKKHSSYFSQRRSNTLKQLNVTFSLKDDSDIVAFVSKKGNKNGYIRGLILADMAKAGIDVDMARKRKSPGRPCRDD